MLITLSLPTRMANDIYNTCDCQPAGDPMQTTRADPSRIHSVIVGSRLVAVSSLDSSYFLVAVVATFILCASSRVMFCFPFSANLLASHTIPDIVPDMVEWGCLFSLLPILFAALFGARIAAYRFYGDGSLARAWG